MDIKKELEQVLLKGKTADEIIKDISYQHRELIKQQEELTKKDYLFRIISLADKIEEAVNQGFFSKSNITTLDMEFMVHDYGHDIVSLLMDKQGNALHVEEQEKFINSLFLTIDHFSSDFAHPKILSDNFEIELTIGVKEKIMDLLLSDELKKILEYNKMELELPSNNERSSKRMKM